MDDRDWMRLALGEARRAAELGEVPVGAVVVQGDELLGAGHNRRETEGDPLAHAELLALRQAAVRVPGWRLLGCTMFVTLEPCAMCAGAISLARVARLVYAAADPKGGAIEHGPRFFEQPTCHHRPDVARAGDAETAGRLLQEFFRDKRNKQ